MNIEYYELCGEITDSYFFNFDDGIVVLETEKRFKALLLIKLANIDINFDYFKEYVESYELDPLFDTISKSNSLNMLDFFVDKFEYLDREKDNGCKITLSIPYPYKDLIMTVFDEIAVSNNEIEKYQIR